MRSVLRNLSVIVVTHCVHRTYEFTGGVLPPIMPRRKKQIPLALRGRIGTVRPGRIANTGPLSEPTIPVFPQAARPTVSERGIGTEGVPGCSGRPRAWKSQPVPGRARGIRGQDCRTPRRPRCRQGEDRPTGAGKPVLQRERENPSSNGREMIDDFRLRGSRTWRRMDGPPKKALTAVVDSYPRAGRDRLAR